MQRGMSVEQINDGVWAMAYLIVDESTNQAAIVDPVYDYQDAYLALLEERGLTLAYAIATHTHADHITGCFKLREATGCEYVMWHATASLGVSMYVWDEDVVMMGETPISFHYTPGHTSDSILIHVPGHIFTGDYLFTGKGGVGRDDLPSGRMLVHWEALDVLNRFEGECLVCTGHDPPGTEMQTLDWNYENNPVLKMESFEEYVDWQNEVNAKLGGVSKIKTAVPANLFAEIPEVIPWLQ